MFHIKYTTMYRVFFKKKEIYKNIDFSKILGMALPGGQNVPTPRESILALSRGSQLPYMKKKAYITYITYISIYRQAPDIPPWRPDMLAHGILVPRRTQPL